MKSLLLAMAVFTAVGCRYFSFEYYMRNVEWP